MKRAITGFGLLLSVALLAWIATRFDLRAAAEAIGVASPLWLTAATGLYCLLFMVRGVRWAILLRHLGPVSNRDATEAFVIGFMANNVLPARLGDVARALVLSRRRRIPAAGTFASVMLERIFDGLVVVGFLNTVLWLAPPAGTWIRPLAYLGGAIFVGALGACLLIAVFEGPTLKLARLVFSPLPRGLADKLLGLIERLGHGIHSLKSVDQTARVIALSLLVWTAEVAVYVLIARAFGLDIPTLGLVLVMCVLTLGLVAPSAPGFVGVFEAMVIEALALYAIVGPTAVAFAVTLHLIHYVPGTLLGLAFTWRSGLRLGDLRSAGETPAAAEPYPASSP